MPNKSKKPQCSDIAVNYGQQCQLRSGHPGRHKAGKTTWANPLADSYHHEFITRKKELGKDRWGFVVKQLRGRIGKREPHPNFAKYLGVLIENGKETIVLHEGMDYVEAVTRTRKAAAQRWDEWKQDQKKAVYYRASSTGPSIGGPEAIGIKSCPFCGVGDHLTFEDFGTDKFVVWCKNINGAKGCGAHGPEGKSMEMAINFWNIPNRNRSALELAEELIETLKNQ